MTDRPLDAATPHRAPQPGRAGDDLLTRAVRRARWTIFWERLWPALASLAGAKKDRETLLRRIEEAARFVDLDQLCLSPQCGFSSTVEGNALTREQQAEKLRLVVEVAGEVWG